MSKIDRDNPLESGGFVGNVGLQSGDEFLPVSEGQKGVESLVEPDRRGGFSGDPGSREASRGVARIDRNVVGKSQKSFVKAVGGMARGVEDTGQNIPRLKNFIILQGAERISHMPLRAFVRP